MMTGSPQTDPRIEAIAREHLCSLVSEFDGLSDIGQRAKLNEARQIVATADAADEASGVRRVTAQELADSPAAMLREFHAAYGLLVADTPTFPPADVADLRRNLLAEEFREYLDALTAADMVEIADALADMVYVIYGTALTYGVDLDAVLAEVHRSNMSKLGGDGKPVLRADGKVMKGPTYFRPDIRRVLHLAADSPVGGVS